MIFEATKVTASYAKHTKCLGTRKAHIPSSYKRMQLNWADIFWSVAPILKVKKLSQMQHLPTKKNVIINHDLVQFRFSKKAIFFEKNLPIDLMFK